MQRIHAVLALLALVAAGCSGGAAPVVEGESVLVAERGTAFTTERRALDAEQGIATATDAASMAAPTSAANDSAVDPTKLAVGGVNPSLASRLQADPSAYATNKIPDLVTFRALSLAGFDVDALLDYLFSDPKSLRRSVETLARDTAVGSLKRYLGFRAPAEGVQNVYIRSAGSKRRLGPLDSWRELLRTYKSLARLEGFRFPAPIEALHCKEAAVVGYILPLEFKPKSADEVRVFMLVRDLMACCFGGAPRPDEWVYVEMEGDRSTKMFPYLPVIVRGTLSVGRLDQGDDGFGLTSGVYSMKAREVQEFKAE